MAGYPISGPAGGSVAPADYANTLTVANQAARLALVYGTGTGEVQELDQVLQTSDGTLWVLLASDPSVSGNWGALNQFAASQITSGTLDNARLATILGTLGALSNGTGSLTNNGSGTLSWVAKLTTPTLTTDRLASWNGTTFADTGLRSLIYSGEDYIDSLSAGGLHLRSGVTTGFHCTTTGAQIPLALAINKGTTAASKMLEVVDSTAAQLRLTHTAGVDFADFTVDTDGNLTLDTSGSSVILGSNITSLSGGDVTLKRFSSARITWHGLGGNLSVGANKSVEWNDLSIGFLGASPVAKNTGWSVTNPTSRKSFDTTTITLPQLAEVVGTLIAAFGDTTGFGLLDT
jgi:hypothetical protein